MLSKQDRKETYRWVRNPMYIAGFSLLIGEAILFHSLLLVGYMLLIGMVMHLFVVFYDEAGPLIKLSYWYAKRRWGEVPEPFAVAANHRKLFFASDVHEALAEKASTVSPVNVRDLALYRVAWTVGCSRCVDFGTMLLRLEGLDVDRLKEIGDYATSPVYTDLLSATPGKRSIT